MKTTRRILSGIFLLAAVLMLTMCKEEGNVESLALSETSLTLKAGETATLTATITPSNSKAAVTWASSNIEVATVSSSGVVTAVADGNVQIVASAGGKNATCEVLVGGVTKISVRPDSLTLAIGETSKLKAKITPSELQDVTTIKWSSENTAVATVGSSTGTVTAVAVGETVISAKGDSKTGKCVLTVIKERVFVTGVKLSKSTLTLMVGDIDTLKATVLPANATTKTVTWSSDKPSFLSVDDKGIITAKTSGTATITVFSDENPEKKATCVVTIVPVAPKSVVITPASGYIANIGGTLQLKAEVLPELLEDSMKTVVWSSADEKIATVSESGLVTGLAKNVVKIRATSKKVPAVYAECEITIALPPVTSVTITPATVSMFTGKDTTLKATVLPEDAGSKTVTWTSSTPAVATVSNAGVVSAKTVGTATITATANNGIKGSCTLTVKPVLVTSVSITPATLDLGANTSETLTATVLPSNASDKTVKWSSSNSSVASVDATTGEVTGINSGTATITATANDGSGKKATCAVTVTFHKITALAISCRQPCLINIGDSYELPVTITPTNASDKTLTWTSSNSSVVSITSTGKITAKAAGQATITAKAADGSNVTTTLTVNVDTRKIYSTYQWPEKYGIFAGNNITAYPARPNSFVIRYYNGELYYVSAADFYKNETLLFSLSEVCSSYYGGIYFGHKDFVFDKGTIYTNIHAAKAVLSPAMYYIYKNGGIDWNYADIYPTTYVYYQTFLGDNGDYYLVFTYKNTSTGKYVTPIYRNGSILHTITSDSEIGAVTVNNGNYYYTDNENKIYKNGILLYTTANYVHSIIVQNGYVYYLTSTSSSKIQNAAWYKNGTLLPAGKNTCPDPSPAFISSDDDFYWTDDALGTGGIYKNQTKIGGVFTTESMLSILVVE
ncbi:MAG: Ig domain-containing protein [Sphingobacteriia bacterium]|nr:Ig domain-containing protein [Sphingobacteriia bacterium]